MRERYKRTGEILPDSALEEFKKFDAMFLGAIGHPDVKPGILEVGILLKTRFALDQYINLGPVKLYPNVETPLKDKGPEHIDFVVVRENTGGIYTGIGGVTHKGTQLENTTQVMTYPRPVVERCVKYAYELTRKRNSKKKMLTLGAIVIVEMDPPAGCSGQLRCQDSRHAPSDPCLRFCCAANHFMSRFRFECDGAAERDRYICRGGI